MIRLDVIDSNGAMSRRQLAALLPFIAITCDQLCSAFSAGSTCSSEHCHRISLHQQSSSSTETSSTSQGSDSSYEALRRKFGLTNGNEPAVPTDDFDDLDSTSDLDVNTPLGESKVTESDDIELEPGIALQKQNDDSISESISIPYDDEQSHLSLNEDTVEPQTFTSSQPETIYFKKFARYTISFTTVDGITKDEAKKELEQRIQRRRERGVIVKLKPETGASDKGVFDGLFQKSNWLPGNIRSKSPAKSRSQLKKAYSSKHFRWMATDSHKPDININPSLVDQDFVAAAGFWRMAVDIISQQTEQTKHHYLALPETSLTVAQHLCDIINWYADYLEADSKTERKDLNREQTTVILRARLDNAHTSIIPVVEFTAIYSSNGARSQSPIGQTTVTAVDTERRTKSWVQRVLVQLGVCPFTKSNVKSGQGLGDVGVPVANIMYRHSEASVKDHGASGEIYTLMADTWEAINDMVAAGPSGKHGVSSILLTAPSFDDDFALWSGPVFAMLEAGVTAIQAEEIIGVVCFHPEYVTPDGSTFPGFGHMHSLPRLKKWYNEFTSSSKLTDNEIAAGGAWQRRTPHAVINVLRAEQLEAAEGRRESGILYERNIRVLVDREEGIGNTKLQEDLRREQSL